ncbi:MAG: aldehyde dehydrogenase family protein [Aliidongia sp.]
MSSGRGAAGRSTTRLVAGETMRRDMIAGLRAWRDADTVRGRVAARVEHAGWSVEQVVAPLGVVGFVFEGRPNVFADAAGVLRSGNAVVFRIGSDALGTARAITRHALEPALAEAGLPAGAVTLLDSAERASGWALFADRRLALAVARGSGPAVAQLGAVARQSGIPVSLHGTGGAWMVADGAADTERFAAVVRNSLDRKVCNTLNVCCIQRSRAAELVPVFLEALKAAGAARGQNCKLHIAAGDETHVPADWRNAMTRIRRAGGDRDEPLCEILPEAELGREWEWEDTPEVSLKIVDDLDQAIRLFKPLQPAIHRGADQRGPGGAGAVLRSGQRALRGRRLHALGRWAICPERAGTRPVQLGERPAARARHHPVGRRRVHAAAPGRADRPGAAPLILTAGGTARRRAARCQAPGRRRRPGAARHASCLPWPRHAGRRSGRPRRSAAW